MAEIKWTNEQTDAIQKKNSNILVAAAAGSGKTAVLVERIIRKIINDGIDIDKMLVVTFTNAAASEMREKILEAIYKKIEEDPNNINLQRQINLLNKSSICTIDSFCLDVLKNNFFEIDIPANIRVADETEVSLLKQEVIDDIFEEKYINGDKDFLSLLEKFTKYNKDEDLQNLILEIYSFIQTTPFPEEWLKEKIDLFVEETQKDNFSETIWGNIIINHINKVVDNCINKEKEILNKMLMFHELSKFSYVLDNDIKSYEKFKDSLKDWDKAFEFINNFKYEKWPTDKKVEISLKQEAKEIRDSVKEDFNKISKIINIDTKSCFKDLAYMHEILQKLGNIIIEFSSLYSERKLENNIVDFSDIEHMALKILVKKDENGNILKTEVAKRYIEKFEEIAIDEYQDSNDIQEMILNSVSRDNNIFMVGDVKQSIYKFRQACPELFLEKYNIYSKDPEEGMPRKIQLFKNFRSRQNVLDVCNFIFKNIMSNELGQIEYTKEEFLNLGADYEPIEQNLKTEVNIINLKENEELQTDSEEKVENIVLEARFVANKIKELIDSKFQVFDKKTGMRDIEYRDIAVLLRSANVVAPIYEKEIANCGIDVYTDTSENYLESIEVDTIMSVLKIINNPMQDIPLVTVMRSFIGEFTNDELLKISLESDKLSFYNRMINYKNNSDDTELNEKIDRFLGKIEKWRLEEKYKSLDELIWIIYSETGYLDYVRLLPNGKIKVGNLKLLFEKAKEYEKISFKGLYNFINFIDRVKISNGNAGGAKILGENENVVRIMSIHKSKGLEFPVVILAESGKQFNLLDLNKKILLHRDLGIGPQYIDEERHIEFKTLVKEALSISVKKEMLAEEMRILYVALTRAKEKLIITGSQKDFEKSKREKELNLSIDKNEDKISPFLVEKYKTYIDWIQLVCLKEKNNIGDFIDLNIIDKEKLLSKSENDIEAENKITFEQKSKQSSNDKRQKEIEKLLNWKYDFKGLEKIESATSVTKVKELLNKDSKEFKTNDVKPKFLMEDETSVISGAQKGTLIHLCLKLMNEKEIYDEAKIRDLINSLVLKELITQKEADSINISSLIKYTKSELWQELQSAKEVCKEVPFYINLQAREIYDFDLDDNILVQGIIDLYYINNQDQLVLVDYKTDFVTNEISLIEEYKNQLSIYKRALEQSLKKKVDKVYIYSLYLNKSIEIEV